MKKNKVKQHGIKIAYLALALFFLCVILFNVFNLFKRIHDHNGTISDIDEINKTYPVVAGHDDLSDEIFPPPNNDYWNYIKVPISQFDLKEFKKLNKDTVGFLSVTGTQINYPVVKSSDNCFYLNHSFKKGENGAGWVFMDYRNNSERFDKNTVIYAHSNLDKTMFGSLSWALKPEWVHDENNGIVKFANSSGMSSWKIFSIYTIPAEKKYIKTDFSNENEYREWAEEMAKRSKYDLGYKFEKNEKTMTFSTCYDNTNDLRLVVHAKSLNKNI